MMGTRACNFLQIRDNLIQTKYEISELELNNLTHLIK
jgi:hypothetical protein